MFSCIGDLETVYFIIFPLIKMHGPRLKEVMASIGWEWPEVIDFDWKLSQIIEVR